MPPRNASNRGGHQRGGQNPPPGGRGGGAGRGRQPGGTPSTAAPSPLPPVSVASHIKTVGVKRPGFGTAGRRIEVQVNSFAVTSFPTGFVHHYDVVEPENISARLKMKLFNVLQEENRSIFEPKIVYDGQKNAFAPRELPLGETNARKFSVSLPQANGGNNPTRPPRLHHITLNHAAKINLGILEGYVNGTQSHDETVTTAITALNVAIRMEPNQHHIFNKRSFYIPEGRRQIGGGLELWRGIFQSIRPAIGRLVVNIDLATGVMYREGPLLDLCKEYFAITDDRWHPRILSPAHGFGNEQRYRLQKFLSGLKVTTKTTGNRPRTIRGLSREGADRIEFQTQAGVTMTVSQYFQSIGMPLQFPGVICVQVGASAMLPLEICYVPRGQFMRKEIPDDKFKEVLAFSTLKPDIRIGQIKKGIQDIQYGQSNYVRQFGMTIETEPMKVSARILNPPKLKYGGTGASSVVEPRNGSWNMVDKKFYKPAKILRWVMVIYEGKGRFPEPACKEVIESFVKACASVGVEVEKKDPLVTYEYPQGSIDKQLRAAGVACNAKLGGFPTIMLVILPEGGNDIYTAVKHFGDVSVGIPTQCLKSRNCTRAKAQFWANVLLKVNVKLGGINVIPDASAVAALTDPLNPTIVMGADVIHPGPGSTDRPSFTAVVGNVDSNAAKYVATTQVQEGRQEIIDDLQQMCKDIIGLYIGYRQGAEKKPGAAAHPKRLIFYRDGVSEGQFQHVLDRELPLIKAACADLKINPKITLIVVGKRHHNQMFPLGPSNANSSDRSGNCHAGSVIDREITHPTEFDFILQSHAGILGTSRPGHYSVLYDESGFNADSIQALSFALCHVYARSTRSVSIPAPVYYADIVCSRAKNHYDPQGPLRLSETSSQGSGGSGTGGYLEAFKAAFKQPHANQKRFMYFSVVISLIKSYDIGLGQETGAQRHFFKVAWELSTRQVFAKPCLVSPCLPLEHGPSSLKAGAMADLQLSDCTASFSIEPYEDCPGRLSYIYGKASHPTLGEVASMRGFLLCMRYMWKEAGDFMEVMDGESDELMHFSVDLFNSDFNLHPWLIDGSRRSGSGCWGEELNTGEIVYLEDLTIPEQYQRHGVGSWLLKEFWKSPVFPAFAPAGSPHVYCWPTGATPTSQNNVVSFFLKNGFRRIGHTNFLCYSLDPNHPSRNIAISDDPAALSNEFSNAADMTPDAIEEAYPLHFAILSKRGPDVIEAIQRAYKMDPSSIHQAGPDGSTPIHLAAGIQKIDAIRKLLELGVADDLANTTNKWGTTPFETLTEAMQSRRQITEDILGQWNGYSTEELSSEYAIKKASNIPISFTSEEEYVAKRMLGCTCGECTHGWLSPRMRHCLSVTAIVQFDSNSSELDYMRGRHPPEEYLSSGLNLQYLPRTLHPAINKGFCLDYITTFRAIRDILELPGGVPDPIVVASDPSALMFIVNGGKVEYVLDALTSIAKEQSPLGDSSFDDAHGEDQDDLPSCENDLAFGLVRRKLGLDPRSQWGPYDVGEEEMDYDDDDDDYE